MIGDQNTGSNAATKLPITVLIAARNEAVNIRRCLAELKLAERIILLDSQSKDGTSQIAAAAGAEVVQFDYKGGYPKKRQWALDHLKISSEWILLLDADEIVPVALWEEIRRALATPDAADAFLITKGFHFLGRRFQFGGFSHSAVLLFRQGRARFEELLADCENGQDMEVHERLLVQGTVARLNNPLIHHDFKGLQAYIDRHNHYSTWEAKLRHQFLDQGEDGRSAVRARLFGNVQERRRFLKKIVMRLPGEPLLWFVYHYFVRLGMLEGKRGLIASHIRASYIAQVRAKIFELRQRRTLLARPAALELKSPAPIHTPATG